MLNELEDLMSMEGAFKKYREAIVSVEAHPCIPYMYVVGDYGCIINYLYF